MWKLNHPALFQNILRHLASHYCGHNGYMCFLFIWRTDVTTLWAVSNGLNVFGIIVKNVRVCLRHSRFCTWNGYLLPIQFNSKGKDWMVVEWGRQLSNCVRIVFLSMLPSNYSHNYTLQEWGCYENLINEYSTQILICATYLSRHIRVSCQTRGHNDKQSCHMA